MKAAHWQQVEQLFHEARELPAAERDRFLQARCVGDDALLREVVTLLAAHGQAGNFIAQPAFEATAAALATQPPAFASGQTLGAYEIIAPVGAGGMGEVYAALDPRLGRRIALKILPPVLAANAAWLHRFQQEARAASALNHPNILTVHEIGQAPPAQGGAHYIATEYIDGVTLRARLNEGALPLGTALELARQIASALAAAHEAGIVHRDIKPENVMIRRDGFVKVLDFGIAKLTNAPAPAAGEKAPHTQTGTLLGTAPYVSPEQARGDKDIDARSDIFSLGAVLYEMLAGQAPFIKATVAETVGAILYTEPPPLAELRPETPPALVALARKVLQKERAARYQSATELQAELTRLKRELDAPTSASAEKPLRKPNSNTARPRRWQPIVRWAVPASLLLGGLVLGWQWYRANNANVPAFQAGIRKLTSTGKVRRAALAPTGNYFVYAEEDGGKQNLLFRQVNGGEAHQIAAPAEVNYLSLNYSPDGEFIYAVRQPLGGDGFQLYRVRAAGGELERLAEGLGSPVALSPEGKRLAFARKDAAQKRRILLTANTDGSGEAVLAAHPLEDDFCVEGIAWSPDGKTIACSAKYKLGAEELVKVTTVRVSDGQERPLSSMELRVLNGMSWLADGSGLIVAAAERAVIPIELYHLAFPSGQMTKTTSALGDLRDVTLDTQTRQLLTVKNTWITNIWTVTPGGAPARQVTSGTDTIYDASWTPDGHLIASIVVNGRLDLWRLDKDGKNRQQLTFGPYPNFRARPTMDGRYIVYVSNQKGTYNVWRINADGTNKQQLTFGVGEFLPQVTPDSQWVYYGSDSGGKRTIWKVSINGGLPTEITQPATRNPVISPDGQWLACGYRENQPTAKWQTAVLPINGGAPRQLLNLPDSFLRWHPNGKALTFFDPREQRRNLFAQSLTETQAKQLTRFETESIYYLDWSPGGKQVALVRGSSLYDVLLLQN